ncbi:MAG: helix-turn-helix transcriptional regulator [Acidobacteria bacterium]|nr:helix-turn-helix transcriptional regulator [Acidobacteriota bacterium]
MQTGTVITTRRAEVSLVEFCLPGEAAQPAGVILHDPETGEYRVRFRRDWESIGGDEADVLAHLAEDFEAKLGELGAEVWLRQCEESLSHVIRISDRESLPVADLDRALQRVYKQRVPVTVQPFVTHLPIYSAQAAAGKFLEDTEVEPLDWIEAPEDLRLDRGMYIVQITGRSMEPKIPDGSLCVFRHPVGGSRENKLLLIERRDVSESGGRYTVKRYHSKKQQAGETVEHKMIRLEPLNKEFEAWELERSGDVFRVIGELIRVLH